MITIPPPSGQHRKPDLQQAQEAAAKAGVILPDQAMLAMQQGRMIEAIKLIRAANPGLDLARAKAGLERMQAQVRSTAGGATAAPGPRSGATVHSDRPPTVEMGDPPGQLRWVLIVLALLAAAGWIVFGAGS